VSVSAPPAAPPAAPRRTLRWWRELLYVLGFYVVYTVVRDLQGSTKEAGASSRAVRLAYHHARDVIHAERLLHMFVERPIQHFFIHARLFLQFWDFYYGTAHFIVTIGALIWLFRRYPGRYALWRNTLALTTGLALIGFALYPLMPPRLLDPLMHTHYGFVDTLEKFGGGWSFHSNAMEKVSNQFAAMPSLHIGWALWCTFVIYPACRKLWTKALIVAYPAITLFAVLVTANHYLLDAVGGAAVFALGFVIARWLAHRAPRLPTDPPAPTTTAKVAA
jgi:hypothetical protein